MLIIVYKFFFKFQIKNNAYDWSYHKGVSKLKYDDEDDINKANQVVEKCRDSGKTH